MFILKEAKLFIAVFCLVLGLTACSDDSSNNKESEAQKKETTAKEKDQDTKTQDTDDIIKAFEDKDLEVEDPEEMTKDDYGFAPFVADKGVRFLIPSVGEDDGGRIFTFQGEEDLHKLKKYYDDLGEDSAALASWTIEHKNVLVQLNGDLPGKKAWDYKEAIDSESTLYLSGKEMTEEEAEKESGDKDDDDSSDSDDAEEKDHDNEDQAKKDKNKEEDTSDKTYLDDYTEEDIEYARIWMQFMEQQDITELNVNHVSAGTPINPHSDNSATYEEDVTILTADHTSDGIITYSSNGDGTINIYGVPSQFPPEDYVEEEEGMSMYDYTHQVIEDTATEEVKPLDDKSVANFIETTNINV